MRNPLRQLRELLSITQESLSQIIGTSTSTVRAVEAGQRKLTDGLVLDVLATTGAEWDMEERRWIICRFISREGGQPYRLQFYRYFEQQRLKRPANAPEQVGELWSRLFEVFDKIPDSRWWDLYSRCTQFIDELRKDFQISELEQISPSEAEVRKEGYRRAYQEALYANGWQKRGWERLQLCAPAKKRKRRGGLGKSRR
jgi:transcriptional regulator with XRE-family HTH domain